VRLKVGAIIELINNFSLLFFFGTGSVETMGELIKAGKGKLFTWLLS